MTPQEFKQNRQLLNLTQKALAEELGFIGKNADRFIRRIESGEKFPGPRLIRCFELLIEREGKKK